jgi:ferredoxin/DNA-binding Lrp family transcriptional regulator
MKHSALAIKDKLVELRQWDKTYKALRKHLDTLPVGLPATLSGVERRLLKAMFSIDDARLAVYMDWHFETADAIFARAGAPLGLSREEVENRLSAMEKKGIIFARLTDGEWEYALHPLIIGMYEMQLNRMNPGFYLDLREYVTKIWGIEYLTSAIPQMRVVPVEKSITPEHPVATYDEIRKIIQNTEKGISIAECICRKAKEMVGEPCKSTNRKEMCLGFRDFGDMYTRNGWGRPISKEEALSHLDQAEKEGLVIQPSNEKDPQFICLCCGCCCGILEMMRTMPKPADFAASNYYVALDAESCNGCGKCVRRCQMGAFEIRDKKAVLNIDKCIGCGLCVTTCKTKSLKLVKKDMETVPPASTEEMFETIMAGKKGGVGRLVAAAKGGLGLKP